jgi:hypothetical protein
MTPHLIRDSEVRESASNAAAEHGASGAARSYLNRLRCMTPAEISYRVVHKLRTWVEPWLDQESDRYEAPTLGREGRPWVHLDAPVGGAPYLAAADRVLSDKHDLLALRDVEIGAPPHWNRDPKTGVEAPLVPGMRLNCRDRRLVGDVRYLWEPNRHMHLVTLAQAYRFSGDLRYLGVIRQHIASWLEACPYGSGPNWANAFEPAVRLINWSITWQLLGAAESMLFSDATGTELRLHWLESVHQHCRFVRRHFSRYSSANHQLVGEAAGLFIAALTWPYWPDSDGWALDAAAVLEREIQEQNFRDGVNREQSVGYQQLELDLLLFAWLAGEASGRPFSATFRARFEAMLEYLASLMDYGGHLPMIGDSDDGCVVRLSREASFSPYRSLLASGALLFRRADFKGKAGMLDDRTRWLFGQRAEESFAALGSATCDDLVPRRAFVDGGYYILGCDFETPREIRLVIDAGPVGLGTIAAHGHADALAITLSIGGEQILVDPGMFTHQGDGLWRDYFRGTAAHNTIRVDGRDQSEPGGDFLWLRKAKAGCSLWRSAADRDEFVGWHDGYSRLADPVIHSRRILLEKRPRRIEITDRLSMKGAHLVEIFFHCSELCEVKPRGQAVDLRHASLPYPVRITLPQAPDAEVEIRRGDDAPICGWRSRAYDEKVPASTLVWRARVSGNTVLVSEIAC